MNTGAVVGGVGLPRVVLVVVIIGLIGCLIDFPIRHFNYEKEFPALAEADHAGRQRYHS